MAALPITVSALAAVTSELAAVEATVTQAVAGALITAQFAEPVIVYTVSSSLNGVLTGIPVVGVTAAGVAATAISEITAVIGPGSSTVFQVLGSVTALIGTVTEVVPIVLATVTSGLGGSMVGTALPVTTPSASLPVTLSTSLPVTLPGASSAATAAATSSSALAVQSSSAATGTTAIAKFTNAAMLMHGAPNNKLMGLMGFMVMFVSFMFGSGFLLMHI